MDERLTRVAKNEALFRAVNREIEDVSDELGVGADGELEVLCECGQDGCTSLIHLTVGEYEQAHEQRDRFIVAPGHETAEIENVVRQTERYAIVDKFGEAEKIAEQ